MKLRMLGTETATALLLGRRLTVVDRQQATPLSLLSLDLSKAFYYLLLLPRLRKFGICGSALDWIALFLRSCVLFFTEGARQISFSCYLISLMGLL